VEQRQSPLEAVVMNTSSLPDPGFWCNKRVLLTGHTGFKGTWLALWLQRLGAHVTGIALPPATAPALFTLTQAEQHIDSHLCDIRDAASVAAIVRQTQPEVVLHLAAQALVRPSYAQPLETFNTNVMGTAHVLDALRELPSVRVAVVVTTDKVYRNQEWAYPYRETDALGGHDPYSASKAATELVTASYRSAFLTAQGVAVATARAGNVIGGGDWIPSRLVPDVLAAFAREEAVVLRNPDAIRPWQHVLEPLAGYLLLAQRLFEYGEAFAEGWNFGPDEADARTVAWIVDTLAAGWGGNAAWRASDEPRIHEAHILKLDCTKARVRLGWRPRWKAEDAVSRSLAWYQAWRAGADMHRYTLDEISEFTASS